jgi:uncharacterized protein YdhG (YjbR/CyaY superfamily)
MKLTRTKFANIDEYIEGFPDDVQKILKKIRTTIRKAAPKAEETISYGIPTFKLNSSLIYFAGFKKHVSVYPAPRSAPEFKQELASYGGGKGTVQFPLDKPIPYDLITRIVKFRMKVLESDKRTTKKTASKK